MYTSYIHVVNFLNNKIIWVHVYQVVSCREVFYFYLNILLRSFFLLKELEESVSHDNTPVNND